MTSALILAAGASTRLGSPKQLVEYNGEKLLSRAIRIAREAGCSSVSVVLGAAAELIEHGCDLSKVKVVYNQDWAGGLSSSIRIGVESLLQTSAQGAVLLPCDMPAITPAHVRALVGGRVETASRYGGRSGIPAYFPRSSFPALLTLRGDKGARELLQCVPFVELANGTWDIDTPADVLQLGSES